MYASSNLSYIQIKVMVIVYMFCFTALFHVKIEAVAIRTAVKTAQKTKLRLNGIENKTQTKN